MRSQTQCPAEFRENTEGILMGQYECAECGYIYDEEKGDIATNVEPGRSYFVKI